MKVLDLRCAGGHAFEGWFASDDDYQSQQQRGLVECPLCGDKQVARLPSAPRLNLSGARDKPEVQVPAAPATSPSKPDLQTLFMQAVRHVIEKTEDVGPRFAEEARRIHYGEAQERGIRGQATKEEALALVDEGIEIGVLPIPPGLKEPLQ